MATKENNLEKWVVNESMREDNVFKYEFEDQDEIIENWNWRLFDTKEEAKQYASDLWNPK